MRVSVEWREAAEASLLPLRGRFAGPTPRTELRRLTGRGAEVPRPTSVPRVRVLSIVDESLEK